MISVDTCAADNYLGGMLKPALSVCLSRPVRKDRKGDFMKRFVLVLEFTVLLTLSDASAGFSTGAGPAPNGWTTAAPRDEIRPQFAFDPKGGPSGAGCFIILADQREGLDGCWKKNFPIEGGKCYRFESSYKASGVLVPRRSIVAKIHWQNDQGRSVPLDEQPVTG